MYAYNLGRTGAPDVANYTRRRQIQRVLQSASSAKAHICRGPGSEGVDHSLRGASTKRSEPHAGQRKGQSKSSDQPTWADKLKTPNGTRPPATNTPPAPDPRDQELRALRVELNNDIDLRSSCGFSEEETSTSMASCSSSGLDAAVYGSGVFTAFVCNTVELPLVHSWRFTGEA
ncbi:hypothetical protein MRX96_020246 [Rhipicephalus microplus]